MLKKGQLYYNIINKDIEPIEFIERNNSQLIHVKNLNNNEEAWTVPYYVCATKEQAYTKLLGCLEYDKLKVEEGIENLEDQLNRINEVIRNLKQKYEQ